MKHEYKKTKLPTIEENYDWPQKKRGGKKKPFRVVSHGWAKSKLLQNGSITLGHYETHARAEQALKKYERNWCNCVINYDIT